MASNDKSKLPRARRAKQFLPFSALAGLEDALAEKEKEIVPKAAIAEEKAAEINQTLLELEKGMMASVKHFKEGEYIRTRGAVVLLDRERRLLCLENNKINFDDIADIDIIARGEGW